MGRRLYYIDWLRVLAVLLLFPFHAGRVFNAGDPFYAKSSIESMPISLLLWFIDRWHMPLLFMLAGMATYFSLRKRGIGQYVRERSLRLLVPLAFGVLVLVPPQTWLGARTNAGYTGSFVEYVTSGAAFSLDNLFGRGDYYGGLSPAHLWFILFLWLISLLVLPLLAYGRTPKGAERLRRISAALARPAWWFAVVPLLLIGDAMPEIGDKNLLYYLVIFVLGYVAIQAEDFMATAERLRVVALVSGVALTLLTMAFSGFGDALPDPSVQRALWVYVVLGGIWLTLVGILGFGRRYLDWTSASLSYLAEASYPLYILHQTVIVVLGFYLVLLVPWPALGWPLLIALALIVTFALYEVVRRVNVLRFLMGMRPRGR